MHLMIALYWSHPITDQVIMHYQYYIAMYSFDLCTININFHYALDYTVQ